MSCISIGGAQETFKPAIAQLVDVCSYQMVPGSIPGGGFGLVQAFWHKGQAAVMEELSFGQQAKQFISNRLTKLDGQADVVCTK